MMAEGALQLLVEAWVGSVLTQLSADCQRLNCSLLQIYADVQVACVRSSFGSFFMAICTGIQAKLLIQAGATNSR